MQDSPCTAAIRVGVGRCTGFVQWAQFSVLAPWLRRFPGRLAVSMYFVPGNCSHVFASGDDEGGLVFFLTKVVRRPLRNLIQPLGGSALLAFPTLNLASLAIVVVRLSVCLSVCRFDFAAC